MSTKYPKIVKVASEESCVEIQFENVLGSDLTSNPTRSWQRKTFPLTIRVAPHNGMIHLSFSNVSNSKIQIADYSPNNQMWIQFIDETTC